MVRDLGASTDAENGADVDDFLGLFAQLRFGRDMREMVQHEVPARLRHGCGWLLTFVYIDEQKSPSGRAGGSSECPRSLSSTLSDAAARQIVFAPIPVHAYDTPIAEERARYGDAKLVGMLRHMLIVREFETMLGDFKARGAYSGIEFAYKGPAHLSVGHEGAAVGAALALAPEDHIFGSHRSHGEFIAKGLAAIDRLDEPAAA